MLDLGTGTRIALESFECKRDLGDLSRRKQFESMVANKHIYEQGSRVVETSLCVAGQASLGICIDGLEQSLNPSIESDLIEKVQRRATKVARSTSKLSY